MEEFFLFNHFTGIQQNATAPGLVSFPLQSSSSSTASGTTIPGLVLFAGKQKQNWLKDEAIIRRVSGHCSPENWTPWAGSNKRGRKQALQGSGLRGKGLNLHLKHFSSQPGQLQREGGKGKSPIQNAADVTDVLWPEILPWPEKPASCRGFTKQPASNEAACKEKKEFPHLEPGLQTLVTTRSCRAPHHGSKLGAGRTGRQTWWWCSLGQHGVV